MTQTTHSPNHADFISFELLIGAKSADDYTITVVDSPAGEGSSLCALDVNGELADALAALESPSLPPDYLTELGAFFFNELFTGDIAALYRTSVGMARSQGKRLRLRLRINAPELASLPWEFLYDPKEEAFLAISAETALVRYVPITLPVRSTSVRPPLRILVVIANPLDMVQLNVAQEKQILQEALVEWTRRGRVQVEFVERATTGEISEAMQRFQPHVFHFIGHGAFQEDTAYVVLENEHNCANLVDEKVFRELFTGCQETRLAVLNACQTAKTSSSQPLIGLAPRLLQRQLSAVVAMQYPISDQASLVFTREFYRSLALGSAVDAAISEARKGIFLELGRQNTAWATPVLFLRAKDGLLFRLEEAARPEKANVPAPPEPEKPPLITNFVGRQRELATYAETLNSVGIVVITGMAGVGKTTLAAQLAQQVGKADKIFWHTFRQGEGIEVIIWRLAGFLAWHKRANLWQMLHSVTQSGGKLAPPEVLFDYLFQLVHQQDYLICFDDFHLVDTDPLLSKLVERLRSAVQASEVRFLITARRIPEFVTVAQHDPLAGLSFADMERLLLERGFRLTPGLLDALHARTEGNAELLTLTINALRRTDNPTRLIDNLIESGDIERYLLNEVDAGLPPEERQVMNGVAALLGYPGTRRAIEEMLGGVNTRRQLIYLSNRYLLQQHDGKLEREYSQHAIVQAFYYDILSRRQRQEMHLQAARYYEIVEPEPLKAAIHYERGGDLAQAASLATADVHDAINRGQARQLLHLLERFREQSLLSVSMTNDTSGLGRLARSAPEMWLLWAKIHLGRGQLYALIGENEQARQSLQAVIATLEQQPPMPETQLLTVDACHDLGDLLQYSAPVEAVAWLQRGLNEVMPLADSYNQAVRQRQAALQIKLGTVQIAQGDYSAAQTSIQQGLNLLDADKSSLRARALINLGTISYYQGKVEQGIAYSKEALAISQKLHDHFLVVSILINLSADQFAQGHWQSAIDDGEKALTMARELGSGGQVVRILVTLGFYLVRLGQLEEATLRLQEAMELAECAALTEYTMVAQINFAHLALAQRQPAEALQRLGEAKRWLEQLGAQWQLPEMYRLYAEAYLQQGEHDQALTSGALAVKQAGDLKMEIEEGSALRVYAQALLITGQVLKARESLQQSWQLLQHSEPLEASLTERVWQEFFPQLQLTDI